MVDKPDCHHWVPKEGWLWPGNGKTEGGARQNSASSRWTQLLGLPSLGHEAGKARARLFVIQSGLPYPIQ